MPHLFSGLIASWLGGCRFARRGMVAVHLEHATIRSTAPELFPLKNQGLAFQRAAARAPNVLPLYGSSELTAVPVPERANIFFRTAPTGFQVSPVGAGGASSTDHVAKSCRTGFGLARQKACYLTLASVVLNARPRAGGLQRKFFANGREVKWYLGLHSISS